MAGPSTIILVRHAEPMTGGASDPSLTTAGKKRAELLAFMLQDAQVTSIFTSDLRRTKETAKPLATKFSLLPGVLTSLDPAANRDRVLSAPAGVAVVVGHTNTVPELVHALGATETVAIGDTEFDRMFVVTRGEGGSKVLSMHYRSA